MFDPVTIRSLREEVAAYAKDFDAALVTADQAVVVIDEAARIEKMAATLKALAGARAADTGVLEREGDASAAHALARRTGTTVGKAADALRTGKRLRSQPALDAAARRGDISQEQAAAISDAVAASPGAEARLVERAGQASLAELRHECERTKSAADRDAEERHRRIHAARCARRRSCPDGSGEIVYRSTKDEVAQVWAVITAYANEAFNRARLAGQREPSEAYAADGVLAMARAAAGGGAHRSHRIEAVPAPAVDSTASPSGATDQTAVGDSCGPGPSGAVPVLTLPGLDPVRGTFADAARHDEPMPLVGPTGPPPRSRSPVPTKIVARVDWAALLRGWVAEGETCEIAGVGPVAVSAVRAMIATGDPFLAAVVTKGVDVVSVAHLGRRPSAHQQSALDWLAPTCRAQGCDATARLENDHRADWAETHFTLLGLIDPLCSHHHDKKTYDGWALVAGTGKRPIVAPDDSRHPRHHAHQENDEEQAMCEICNGKPLARCWCGCTFVWGLAAAPRPGPADRGWRRQPA